KGFATRGGGSVPKDVGRPVVVTDEFPETHSRQSGVSERPHRAIAEQHRMGGRMRRRHEDFDRPVGRVVGRVLAGLAPGDLAAFFADRVCAMEASSYSTSQYSLQSVFGGDSA